MSFSKMKNMFRSQVANTADGSRVTNLYVGRQEDRATSKASVQMEEVEGGVSGHLVISTLHIHIWHHLTRNVP